MSDNYMRAFGERPKQTVMSPLEKAITPNLMTRHS
jgi:hypothetical protein